MRNWLSMKQIIWAAARSVLAVLAGIVATTVVAFAIEIPLQSLVLRLFPQAFPDPATLHWMNVEAKPSKQVLPVTRHLGAGELDAVGIALERPGSLVLLDDRLAREYAHRLRVRYTGTLGVLLRAKHEQLLPVVHPVLDRLRALGFRLAPATRAAVLEQAGETE